MRAACRKMRQKMPELQRAINGGKRSDIREAVRPIIEALQVICSEISP
jgi:hypothetical protein